MARGKEAKVPKVPGPKGKRPAPNQVERTKAAFPPESDCLKALSRANLSDWGFDIKPVSVHGKRF
jgi:hypothetical protein